MPSEAALKSLCLELKQARERLSLSTAFCAGCCGVSIDTYDDLERRGDEFFDDLSLGTVRRLCRLLGLDLFDLTERHLGTTLRFLEPAIPFSFHGRAAMIAIAREVSEVTNDKFESETGWEAVILDHLTRTPDFIETMPIAALLDIARCLDLDPARLIGKPTIYDL